jgi:LPXTG-site transpeptidase (sortase) family protein
MMDKITAVPIKRLLLVAISVCLGFGLLALRSSQDVAAPRAPEPTATVQASSPSPTAQVVTFRMITALPPSSQPQPTCTPPMNEAAGQFSAAPTQTPRPEPPAPLATSQPMGLPGAGSVYERPERVVPGPRAVPDQPDPTPTLLPVPEASQPPTRIVAPAIGLDASVVPVSWKWIKRGNARVAQWQVPKNQVGWHRTSALPGQVGNTVLSGHRNIYAEVFRYLPDLEPGDEITLYAGDKAYVYIVAEKHIVKDAGVPANVRLENGQWIATTDDVRLTMVTCAPYEAPGNTHRVIVVARPGPFPSES